MDKIESLKRPIVDFIEQINDGQELKNFRDFLEAKHEEYEEERTVLEKLKERIGEKRFNEFLTLSWEKTGKEYHGSGELKKWAKEKFPEITYKESDIILNSFLTWDGKQHVQRVGDGDLKLEEMFREVPSLPHRLTMSIDTLKKDLINFIEEHINDEQKLTNFLDYLKPCHDDFERKRKERKALEELKERIGTKRLNEIIAMAKKETSKEGYGVTKLRKWLKEQFGSQLTQEDTRIIAGPICYPALYGEEEEEESESGFKPEEDGKTPHQQVIDALKEIGTLKGYETASEFRYGNFQYDGIWRKIPGGNPYFVFEVQVGGNLIEAIAKLKHAHDTWNSKICLVSDQQNLDKASTLLVGSFHEIKGHIELVLTDTIGRILTLRRKLKEVDTLS